MKSMATIGYCKWILKNLSDWILFREIKAKKARAAQCGKVNENAITLIFFRQITQQKLVNSAFTNG